MTLHTWNKRSGSASTLAGCLAVVADGDTLLLLEDGVYLAMDAAFLSHFDPGRPAGPRLCVLSADLLARGLAARISPAANVVGYEEFVALSLHHQRVVNWF